MQLTPNGVRWINWFLAWCDKMGYQPTLKLFHQLFFLLWSNHLPLYELPFRGVECDYGPGHNKPVIQQSSLKYWNGELMFPKGLDLDYMPQIAIDHEVEDFLSMLKDEDLTQVFNFCECLGYQLTQDMFMKHRTLFKHGCKLPFSLCSS